MIFKLKISSSRIIFQDVIAGVLWTELWGALTGNSGAYLQNIQFIALIKSVLGAREMKKMEKRGC